RLGEQGNGLVDVTLLGMSFGQGDGQVLDFAVLGSEFRVQSFRLQSTVIPRDGQAEAAQIERFARVSVNQLDDEGAIRASGGRLLEMENGLRGFAKTPPDVPDLPEARVNGPGDVRVRLLVVEARPGVVNGQESELADALSRRLKKAKRG